MGQMLGYLPQHWPSWFALRFIEFAPRPVGPFPASYSLTHAEDVIVLLTPGHTPHHISVLVDDGDISYFLAGDASYNEQLMLEGAVDGVSPNAQVARQTMACILPMLKRRPWCISPARP